MKKLVKKGDIVIIMVSLAHRVYSAQILGSLESKN